MKNTLPKFPSNKLFFELNEKLLKTYLKMNVEENISNVVDLPNLNTNKNVKVKDQDNKICNNNSLVEISDNIFNLNKIIKINNQDKSLFLLNIKQEQNIKELFEFVEKEKFLFYIDSYNTKDITTIYDTKTLDSIKLKEIIKIIFINLIKTKQVPNFCNLWIFGNESSMSVQGTYIPLEQGSYSDDDYLDLMIDIVPLSYNIISEQEIYSNINLNKENEGLYFLLFK